jgi:hypothetical protein
LVGYNFNEKDQIHIGLTQVPWYSTIQLSQLVFQPTYYVGLEDDHDMGFKYMHRENLNIKLPFKNAEELRFGNNTETSPNRYSYDILVGTKR